MEISPLATSLITPSLSLPFFFLLRYISVKDWSMHNVESHSHTRLSASPHQCPEAPLISLAHFPLANSVLEADSHYLWTFVTIFFYHASEREHHSVFAFLCLNWLRLSPIFSGSIFHMEDLSSIELNP